MIDARMSYVLLSRHVLILLAMTSVASAQTRPTTAVVAPIPGDQSSPRSAFKAVFLAQMAADPERLRAVLYAKDERARRLLEARVAHYKATLRLTDVGLKYWGVGAYTMFRLPPRTPMTTEEQFDQAIGAAPETVDGDTGSLKFDDRAVRFVKVDGLWRLPIEEDVRGAEDPSVMEAKAKAMDDVAAQIESGKLKSADAAVNLLVELYNRNLGLGTTTRPAK
jgi:hypothetical protein